MVKKLYLLGSICLALGLWSCQSGGETKVDDIPSSDFNIETISSDLVKPWNVEVMPSGDYLVTEFAGGLKLIKDGKVLEVAGLPEDLYVNGQGGFMGLVLAPDFSQSKEVFISYAYGSKSANNTAIYKARLEGNELVNGETIFRADPKDTGSHFGGQMEFMPGGNLILTLGDGFSYREKAQDLDSHLGKIMHLDRNGGFPEVYIEGAKDGIFSYGHRNVQGLAYDAESGNLWAHEHGPKGGDELNLLKAGANYGWPLASTGIDYNGARITPYETFEGTENYVYDWVPSIAPSGLVIYRGNMFPEWNGDALIGALAGTSVWRVDLDGTKAVGETRLLHDLGSRVRDVKVDRDGALLVLTEGQDGGKLLRVTP